MVLLDPQSPGERDEDEDERDIYSPPPDAAENGGEAAAPPPDSNVSLLPDVEDVAQEALTTLESPMKPPKAYLSFQGSTKKQHKATILRIFSSRFSILESRDRLKHVPGYSRHSESSAEALVDPSETIAGEPMIMARDPAAILVRCNDFTWLAVVAISGIARGTKLLDALPKRLLAEPNVRVKVQIMDLNAAQSAPRPGSEDGDWEWRFPSREGFCITLPQIVSVVV
ncbi:hypothetical protein B0H10DRAFT_2236954 [Mycena sp. CBHHK59/15]|nr:hypothetical protein B0H10DRAFT_2236954 [Mycena sp. CBHHK59/15]